MSREWGRESYAGDWPSRKPTGILLALVIAVASVAVIEAIQYKRERTFAQRFYLSRYLQTGLAGKLRKGGYYTLLTVVDRRGRRFLPLADELAPATNADRAIDGISYSGHALDEMQSEGITPSVVKDAIENGSKVPSYGDRMAHFGDGVKVVTDRTRKVITVMLQSR